MIFSELEKFDYDWVDGVLSSSRFKLEKELGCEYHQWLHCELRDATKCSLGYARSKALLVAEAFKPFLL